MRLSGGQGEFATSVNVGHAPIMQGRLSIMGSAIGRGSHQRWLCRINGQLRGEQADGQATTIAVATRRRPSPPASANPGAQCGVGGNRAQLVSRLPTGAGAAHTRAVSSVAPPTF
jgi:hypothetical protein